MASSALINIFTEKSDEEDDYILPPDYFEMKKQAFLIEVPYSEKNETSS